MDTLAARLREAFLGTETGEAVPFDELKDAVRDRWQRVADAAREVPPEGIALAAARERGHRAAIRVPFSDDQIERMAKAAQPIVYEGTKWHIIDESAKTALRQGIRAALAAGGLEPCAVPEYEPEDVALSPSDDEVEALARALHAAWNVKRFGVAPKWEDSTVQDAYRDEARAAIAHMRPTHGHVLRDRLVEAEAKIGRQRKNLRQLYEARERDARLIAELRAEVDEDNAAAASVNDLLVQVQNLTAERDAQEIELTDLRFYQREFAAVSSERDALRERASVPVKVRWAKDWTYFEGKYRDYKYEATDAGAVPMGPIQWASEHLAAHAVIDAPVGVPSVAPTDDQVEALARVLHKSQDAFYCRYGDHATKFDDHTPLWSTMARAALAHMSKRPEGLPTAEEMHRAWMDSPDKMSSLEWCRWSLDYLRPWLRDPVGFEMDVAWQEMQEWLEPDSIGRRSSPHEILDLCRKRIRPVYECKECAKKDTRIDMYERQQNMMAKSIEVQRQGLERAAAAARAALEGE